MNNEGTHALPVGVLSWRGKALSVLLYAYATLSTEESLQVNLQTIWTCVCYCFSIVGILFLTPLIKSHSIIEISPKVQMGVAIWKTRAW